MCLHFLSEQASENVKIGEYINDSVLENHDLIMIRKSLSYHNNSYCPQEYNKENK